MNVLTPDDIINAVDIVEPCPSQFEIAMNLISNAFQLPSLIIFIILLVIIISNKIKNKKTNKLINVCLAISIVVFVATVIIELKYKLYLSY